MMRSRRWWRGLARTILLAGVAATVVSTVPVVNAQEPTCTDCHDVDTERVAASVHGFVECTDCHAGAAEVPHEAAAARADCSSCHDDVVSDLAASVHGPQPLSCETCHGPVHALVPLKDEASPVNPRNLPRTCGNCHADPEVAERLGIHRVQPLEVYLASVHGRAVAAGEHAASCNDCHGSHRILPAGNPESRMNFQNVPHTCGKCHTQIAAVYAKSVHGVAVARGEREAPVCVDCHGEHRILSPEEKDSPVFATNIPKLTCGRCHGDLHLAEKYGFDIDRVPAYQDSYHGLAIRSGLPSVANCSSCHGVHDILPSSDPASSINPANLAATCGKCHPGAGAKFAIGPVHVVPKDRPRTAVWWIRLVYLSLIWSTIGLMVLHNGADLFRKIRNPLPPPPPAPVDARERMAFGFRVAHGLLVVSFVVLGYSGFALTYPEAWWAKPLLHWESHVALRGTVHRTAAVVLMIALFGHIVHLATSRRARSCIREMLPNRHDLVEIRERLTWFLGGRTTPPRSPWIGYPEKAEYWALMWGLVVMAATGFLLWGEGTALRLFPTWVADVSTVIHFYEAVLATLAIIVWHLYFVIFDPVVYPLDKAWLTGRSPAGRVHERAEPSAKKVHAAADPPHAPSPEPDGGTETARQPGVLRVLQSRGETRRFYDKIAGVYDLLAERSEEPVRREGVELLAPARGERVLEIGCGTGHVLAELSDKVGVEGEVHGVDLSLGMLRRARSQVSGNGSSRIRLVCGDGGLLPYAAGRFDALMMSFTLELFDTPEIPRVLAECRRVLRPGGRLVVVGMSKDGPDGALLHAFEWTHRHLPNLVDCRPIFVKRAVEDAGFVIDEARHTKMWVPVEIVRGRNPAD